MNKIFILITAVFFSVPGFAQKTGRSYVQPSGAVVVANGHNSLRTTVGAGDTLILKNSPDTSLAIYRLGPDSGYVYGTNYWSDQAFAEQYNVSDSNRNMQVVGILAAFNGKTNSSTTNTVTFYVWDKGPQQSITGSLFYSGFPNNILDSVTVPLTQLGVGVGTDTAKEHFFVTGTGNLTSSFFVGYGLNYNFLSANGDTIGLYSSRNGVRNPSSMYSIVMNVSDFNDTTIDTIINVQNATLGSDNNWYDNYTQYDSLLNNLKIFPVVVAGFPTTTGITRNNLTFFGNYPNPANSSTDVRFGLAANEDVTIQVIDICGHVLSTSTQRGLSAGTHSVPVNTGNLPSGDYLYLVRTSAGEGIAGKMVVAH